MVRRALLSVSDKSGIEPFAQNLVTLGYELLSTGGTLKLLQEKGIQARGVEEVTEFPECFGGRVKTMHPKIMGGILYRRENPDDVKEAAKHGIEPIDVVVVNLYPFAKQLEEIRRQTSDVRQSDVWDLKSEISLIEMIDIGGPTLLRSAAKNHSSVTVVCDPGDYDRVIDALKGAGTTPELRQELAAKVFLHTAKYDALITDWMSAGKNTGLMLQHGTELRYGENPHQWGKYYDLPDQPTGWKKLQGKEVSYLNILDADGAWSAVCDFAEPTAVFVKHANPSGIASDTTIDEAFQRAYDADRLSAFGVIIALNRPCSAAIAQKIIDQKMFVEVILAPEFDADAVEILKQKPNIRVLHVIKSLEPATTYRSALGGMLLQNPDTKEVLEKDLTVVTKKQPTPEQIRDLLFAWKCVKSAKSNAIVFAKDLVTVGIGAGQTSRVDATWIAAKRMEAQRGSSTRGAVMASDAFFPFPDSVEEAAKHGIAAIIQPGGSVKDAEVFAKADELGIAMVTTGVRAFRH